MINFDQLISWSKDNYQNLPWRQNRSLYTTLVSEIMLQQTTVGTVLNHYPKFIEKFSNFEALAQAKEDELAKIWIGLGYYRRAKNLHNASQMIVEKHQSKLPQDYDELLTIKGIGEYTANAIISIGHNNPALALDGNLKRVLSRIFNLTQENEKKLKKAIYELLENKQIHQSISKVGWRAFNEALMDLGRVICQAKKVYCADCPVSDICKTKDKSPLEYPKLITRKTKMINLDLLRYIHIKDGKLLVYQKEAKQWLSNQWELPTFTLTQLEKFHQYPYLERNITKDKLTNIKTFITKYKITNYLIIEEPTADWFTKHTYRYIELAQIFDQKIICSTATIKSLKKLGYL